MKKTTLTCISLIGLLPLICFILISSCKKDKCKSVACLNGGTCTDGTCNCPPGFTGANCETNLCANVHCLNGGTCSNGSCNCPPGYEGSDCGTESRVKFLGNYILSGTSECSISGSDTLSSVPMYATASGSIAAITLNFSGISLSATVSGNTFTVPYQNNSNGYSYSGHGWIQGNTLSLYLNESGGGSFETCTYTLSGLKQ